MKKELCAGALLLVLFGASLYNIAYLTGFASELSAKVGAASRLAAEEEEDGAEAAMREAIDQWLRADGYTHVFIRHSEIDATSDAFYDALSEVSSSDKKSAAAAFEKLKYHLTSIATMEQLSIGSIF